MTEASKRVIFQATIDQFGAIRPEKVNETLGRLQRFVPKVDRRVTVTVGRYVKPKSNDQLALYFSQVLPPWAEFVGDDLDEMHKDLKRAFLVPQLILCRLTGEEVAELPSLADLTVEEMSAYLDRVLREGRQRGIEFVMDRGSE